MRGDATSKLVARNKAERAAAAQKSKPEELKPIEVGSSCGAKLFGAAEPSALTPLEEQYASALLAGAPSVESINGRCGLINAPLT